MIYLIGNDAILPDSPHYQLATIDDVVSYCIDKEVLGVDTETAQTIFYAGVSLVIGQGIADSGKK